MEIRGATVDDVLGIAQVHVRSWQEGYRGLLPQGYLDALVPQDRAAHYRLGDEEPADRRTLVGMVDGLVVGFTTVGRPADIDDHRCGEVMSLYVDPGHWNTGLGRTLIATARATLVERGFEESVLWVLAGNTRAMRFYEIDGWAPDGAVRQAEVWGLAVDELRYRRALP